MSAAPAPVAPPVASGTSSETLPSDKVLQHAVKIALEMDKPIMLDYWRGTQAGGTAFLGKDKETNEKILVNNADEYTSPVQKMFKIAGTYIIVTENSIYIVSGDIKMKEISGM